MSPQTLDYVTGAEKKDTSENTVTQTSICEFCKSYTHQTSVCRSYTNFVRAHPMASSRRTSPAQIGRQQEWPQEPSEEAISSDTRVQNDEDQREGERKRELSEIT